MAYSCVVVGTDGSPTAERAVAQAAGLAAPDGARLVIVTAFEPARRTAMEQLAGSPPAAEAARQDDAPGEVRWMLTERGQAEGVADRGRALAREAGVDQVVIGTDEGDPAEVILGTAELHEADLVVVGSVGLVGAERFLLGSVATSILHHAPCDVLVVDTR